MTYDSIKKTIIGAGVGVLLATTGLVAGNKKDVCALQPDLTYSKNCITDMFASKKSENTLNKYSSEKTALILSYLNDNMDETFISQKVTAEQTIILSMLGSPEYSFHEKAEAISLFNQINDNKLSSKTKKTLVQSINPQTSHGICYNLSDQGNNYKDLCMQTYSAAADVLLQDGKYIVPLFTTAMELSDKFNNKDFTKSGPYKTIEKKFVVDPKSAQKTMSSKKFNNFLKSKMALKSYLEDAIESEEYNSKANSAAQLYVKMRCKMGPQSCMESKLFIKENNPKFYKKHYAKPKKGSKRSSRKGKSKK